MNSHELLKLAQSGDSGAAAVIFDRYVERLLALARSRLAPKLRRRIDAEDVVQSAYRSFFVHAENQEFVLNESGDLWRLLVRITLNKLYSQAEKHTAARRNIRREQETENDLPDDPVAVEPTAAEVVALTERLQLAIKALDPTEQRVLNASLSGDTVEAIAVSEKKSPRTVRRLLAHTRQRIEKQLVADSERSGAT